MHCPAVGACFGCTQTINWCSDFPALQLSRAEDDFGDDVLLKISGNCPSYMLLALYS